jgi:hypothetical protein
MKLKGKRPGIHVEPVILPRPDGDLEFLIKAIDNFDEFEKLCPLPKPPAKILPNNERVENTNDPAYVKKCEAYGVKRMAYIVVKGLMDGTPDLEWETVDISDNTTWSNFRKELRDSGLSDIEINRLVNGALVANSLSERAVEEARKRFLAGLQAPRDESSSLVDELASSQSGEPASDST